VRAIAVAARFQAFAQFLVVVEFTVVNDLDIVGFVADGLMAGLDVDDAQAPHRQADVTFHEETVIIGAAMNNLPVHLGERFPLHPA
jgi:hypothetical protein